MKTFRHWISACTLSALCTVLPAQTKMPAPWQSSLVKISKSGELVYIPDEEGNVIPDFSRVGYHHGNQSIPQHSVTRIISQIGRAHV